MKKNLKRITVFVVALIAAFNITAPIKAEASTLFDKGITTTRLVRMDGELNWNKAIQANKGDIVEIAVVSRVGSDDSARELYFDAYLPDELLYIDNSATLYSSCEPGGASIDDELIQGEGATVELGADDECMITFKAQVVSDEVNLDNETLKYIITVDSISIKDRRFVIALAIAFAGLITIVGIAFLVEWIKTRKH